MFFDDMEFASFVSLSLQSDLLYCNTHPFTEPAALDPRLGQQHHNHHHIALPMAPHWFTDWKRKRQSEVLSRHLNRRLEQAWIL